MASRYLASPEMPARAMKPASPAACTQPVAGRLVANEGCASCQSATRCMAASTGPGTMAAETGAKGTGSFDWAEAGWPAHSARTAIQTTRWDESFMR